MLLLLLLLAEKGTVLLGDFIPFVCFTAVKLYSIVAVLGSEKPRTEDERSTELGN